MLVAPAFRRETLGFGGLTVSQIFRCGQNARRRYNYLSVSANGWVSFAKARSAWGWL